MPTVNPRITVTLRPSLHATLRRMSELTRNSQSAIVAEILEQSQPIFEKMVLVMEAAARAQVETKNRVAQGLEAAHSVLDRQLGLMLDDLGTRTADLVDELETVPRRAKKGTVATAGRGPGGAARRTEPPGPRLSAARGGPPPLTGGSPSPQRPGVRRPVAVKKPGVSRARRAS